MFAFLIFLVIGFLYVNAFLEVFVMSAAVYTWLTVNLLGGDTSIDVSDLINQGLWTLFSVGLLWVADAPKSTFRVMRIVGLILAPASFVLVDAIFALQPVLYDLLMMPMPVEYRMPWVTTVISSLIATALCCYAVYAMLVWIVRFRVRRRGRHIPTE